MVYWSWFQAHILKGDGFNLHAQIFTQHPHKHNFSYFTVYTLPISIQLHCSTDSDNINWHKPDSYFNCNILVIRNHADELTLWVPLLLTIYSTFLSFVYLSISCSIYFESERLLLNVGWSSVCSALLINDCHICFVFVTQRVSNCTGWNIWIKLLRNPLSARNQGFLSVKQETPWIVVYAVMIVILLNVAMPSHCRHLLIKTLNKS